MLIDRDTLARLCRARELLCALDGEVAAVPEVARQVGISPFHFIRQFRALFGVTPHQARIGARLEAARERLVLGDRPVTEVGLEVGFGSASRFSAEFSRRIGASPTAYRRRARALVQVPGTWPPALVPGCMTLMARLPAGAFSQFSESAAARDGASSARHPQPKESFRCESP